MLTIRPWPAACMAVNAARQHRNVPVRLTLSVSSHIFDVVSVNGAGVSTPAAQTSAPSWPVLVTSANRRSTSVSWLTSVGTGVAWPPASRIRPRSEEHTSELQSLAYLVCRLLLEKKNRSFDSLMNKKKQYTKTKRK